MVGPTTSPYGGLMSERSSFQTMGDNAATTEQAKELVNVVLRLAREDDHKGLWVIDTDPATDTLLSLLSDKQTAQARTHLKAARAWQVKQNRKARDKFASATKALEELDLVLARGILRKLDTEIFEPPELDRYDELLLAITARSIELEEIESQIRSDPPEEKRRFRRR